MPEHINLTEAARRFGVSDRTLRNWVRWGWLGADRVIIEGRAHQIINIDELRKVMEARGIPEPTGQPEGSGMTFDTEEIKEVLQRLEGRILDLEIEQERLKGQIYALRAARGAALPSEGTEIAPAPQKTPLAGSEREKIAAPLGGGSLPPGWVGAEQFRHGIPSTTVLRWVRNNGGVSGMWLNAQHKKVLLALPPAVQHAFYVHFSTTRSDDFQPCTSCPHKPEPEQ